MRNRIEAMKRKVRIAGKRLKEIALQKEELERSMKDTTNRKMNAEFPLRSQQSDLPLNSNNYNRKGAQQRNGIN